MRLFWGLWPFMWAFSYESGLGANLVNLSICELLIKTVFRGKIISLLLFLTIRIHVACLKRMHGLFWNVLSFAFSRIANLWMPITYLRLASNMAEFFAENRECNGRAKHVFSDGFNGKTMHHVAICEPFKNADSIICASKGYLWAGCFWTY